jgi:hypothetical protein
MEGLLVFTARAATNGTILGQPLQNSYDNGVVRAARDLGDGGVGIGLTRSKLDADGYRGMDASVSGEEGPPGFVGNGVDDDIGTGGQGARLAVQSRTV